jgi:hypothetical protein
MRTKITVSVLGLLVVAGLAINQPIAARTSVVVAFVVPHGTPIEGSIGYDRLTFTGRSVGTSDVGECDPGNPGTLHHVQHGVLTPGPSSDGGATRLTGIIQLTGTEIPPGTRLYPLQPNGSPCEGADGMLYDKYFGEVDESQQ